MAFSRLRTSIGRFVRSVASSPASATVFAVEGVTGSKSAAGEAYSRWTAGAAASFAIAASTSAFLSDDAFSWCVVAHRITEHTFECLNHHLAPVFARNSDMFAGPNFVACTFVPQGLGSVWPIGSWCRS